MLCRRPLVHHYEGMLSLAQCDRLVRLVATKMGACELHGNSHTRSSSGCWLPRFDSPRAHWQALGASREDVEVVREIDVLLSGACGLPPSHGEPAQVLRYLPGQRYDVHPDFFDPEDAYSLANGGQRLYTCLVYLTTVPAAAGGATFFPRALVTERRDPAAEGGAGGARVALNDGPGRSVSASRGALYVQPVAGDAVLWRNTLRNGAVDPRSVHAGLAVRNPGEGLGEHPGSGAQKWVLSKWIRARPFQLQRQPLRRASKARRAHSRSLPAEGRRRRAPGRKPS